MKNPLVQLLEQHGPALSGNIAARLRAAGRSPEAARQCLSRLPERVRVLRGLPFPKKARFLFLDTQYGTEAYWATLAAAVKESNPAYSAALTAIETRGGIIPRAHFDIVSGAPGKQKGQLSADVILQRLLDVKLCFSSTIEGIGECISLTAANVSSAQLRARLVTEKVLLDGLRTWAGRMNMAGANTTRIRDDSRPPTFATFQFDLCGPCYLRPMRRWTAKKVDPGFLVADVVLGTGLTDTSIEPFLRKCTTLGHLQKVRPFLPMLIADSFTAEALRKCRGEGIIATRPETVFGEDVGHALSDLLKTLSNAAAIAAANPDRIEKLFASLSKIEGAAGNIRGALFEVVVGHMVRSIEGGSIDIGPIVGDGHGGRAEIDVRLVKERNVIFYECKGHQSSARADRNEVETWLTKKIPIIVAAHQQQPAFSGGRFKFEFWTCGGFDDDAIQLLTEAKSRTKKYDLDWKSGPEIREYAKQLSAPGIKKILMEHYFEHPTASLNT